MSQKAKIFQYSQGVNEKQEELRKIEKILKTEFVGIDHIIEKVIKAIESWRIMPEAQNRPTIINLWGMTGTGKTSLVRRISKLLNCSSIEIDLGEFSNKKNFAMSFYDKYKKLSNKECIMLLDEIQNCNTICNGGAIDREGLRGLWSLLSDGQIIPDVHVSTEYYISTLEEALFKYGKKDEEKTKIKSSRKILVSKKPGEINEIDDPEYAEEEEEWKLESWLLSSILSVTEKNVTVAQIKKELDQDYIKTVNKMLEWLKNVDIQPQLNYNRSVIFVAGNLDEIYTSSHNTNPDLTADELHKISKDITVPCIKEALSNRFKPEQVARLGNKHLIYYAFNEQNFKDIIDMELEKINKFINDKFEVNIQFEQSVRDIVYREGVYPTQGARPVLNTVDQIVKNSIPSCMLEIVKKFEPNPLPSPINVKMGIDPDNAIAIFELIDKNDMFLNHEKIYLDIEKLRKPVYDDMHISIAVHEAGHTVCQIIESGTYPIRACAFSPNTNSEGYIVNPYEKSMHDFESFKKQIVLYLGGWAAETVIFGKENTSIGSSSDLMAVGNNASSSIRVYGFGDIASHIPPERSSPYGGPEYSVEEDKQVRELIEECKVKAIQNIKENKVLVLDIANELLKVPSMNAKNIQSVVKKHRKEKVIKHNRQIQNKFEKLLSEENLI